MRTGPMLQLVLLLVLLAESSEEFFFEYPKKALMEFFQSLKAKKQPPKIQHYHVHYYPIPLIGWRAPDKRDLEKLYEDAIKSFGWSDHYKYIPDPSIIIPSSLQLWNDYLWGEEILESDDTQATIDRSSKGILVQVPVGPQFLFQMLKKSRKETT